MFYSFTFFTLLYIFLPSVSPINTEAATPPVSSLTSGRMNWCLMVLSKSPLYCFLLLSHNKGKGERFYLPCKETCSAKAVMWSRDDTIHLSNSLSFTVPPFISHQRKTWTIPLGKKCVAPNLLHRGWYKTFGNWFSVAASSFYLSRK